MKKITLAASVIALGMSSAFAADGLITINGMVSAKTCDIEAGSENITVTLPTVSKQSLAAVGEVAGRTPFTIKLTKCSAGKVATYFEPGSSVDFNSGRLKNVTGSATNVQVQLLGDNNLFIPVLAAGSNGVQSNSQLVDVLALGSANLNYYAEYYATGASTVGTVGTSVQYTLVYQ